jgi:hypothetical protein
MKINSFNTGSEDQEVLLTFGKKVAENFGKKGSFPSLLATFPPEGKVKNSDKFISKKFLGYPFLHSAFTADYEISGEKFKLFVIDGGDEKECRNMIRKYLDRREIQKDVMEGHNDFRSHYRRPQLAGTYIWVY